jgi:hypothetical protein
MGTLLQGDPPSGQPTPRRSSLWQVCASIIFPVGIVIMEVSYSKEVFLVGRYVTSIIFPVVKVIIGVSNSNEVLRIGSLLQGGPPGGRYSASNIYPMGIVIMGVHVKLQGGLLVGSLLQGGPPSGQICNLRQIYMYLGCGHHWGVLFPSSSS